MFVCVGGGGGELSLAIRFGMSRWVGVLIGDNK